MATNYVQEGDVLQHVATATTLSGDVVVIGSLLGVALSDAAIGETVSVSIEGVWTLPKVTTAVMAAGSTITWDVSLGKCDDSAATAAAGDLTLGCVAVNGAINGDTTVDVLINLGVNTVT